MNFPDFFTWAEEQELNNGFNDEGTKENGQAEDIDDFFDNWEDEDKGDIDNWYDKEDFEFTPEELLELQLTWELFFGSSE